MKRIITISILAIAFLFIGNSVFAAEETSEIYIDTGGATSTPLYGTVVLSVKTDNPNIDLANSTLTWFIDPNKEYMQLTGIASLPVETESKPLHIRVRVNPQNQPGLLSFYEATIDLTPGTTIETYEKSSTLVPVSKRGDEARRVIIKASPLHPKEFQRVIYTAYIDNATGDDNLDDKLVKWTINGKEKPGERGLYKYAARVSSPSQIATIRVDVDGIGWDEIELIPRSDPRLRITDSQAKRVARCASQSLLMIQRDIDVMKRRVDLFDEKYKVLKEKLGNDIVFLGKTATSIIGEAASLVATVVEKGIEFGVKAILDPNLRRSAKELVALGELLTNNDITHRLKYIYEEVEYYTKLIDWINQTQYNIQADIDSMAERLDGQTKRCIDLANEKIEYPLEFRDINEFKKYEW